jgi:activator of HSP90 ATPase
VVGRNIELVSDTRIVQAWRDAAWPPGAYSLVTFALSDAAGGGTTLVFDHTGFPAGDAAHLAEGWTGNYWEPMKKVLG